MREKPVVRVRRSGALLVAALIAFVGALPIAGLRWAWAPILLVPLVVGVYAWRAGTDVFPDFLRVRAMVGSTVVPFDRVVEFAPNERRQVAALLDNGHMIKLTGVNRDNLPDVLRAAGRAPAPAPEEDQ